jgi:hypothetical protein
MKEERVSMRNKTAYIGEPTGFSNKSILLICIAILSMMISCKSAPKALDPPPSAEEPIAAEPISVDPNQQAPGQAALDELNAAMARAETARGQAVEAQGSVYFPDEWDKAESDNEAGKRQGRDTVGRVREAIALFTSAAEGYEAIAENSGKIMAKEQQDASRALRAAITRVNRSRKNAEDNKGPAYFPNDWKAAENLRQEGEDANKTTVEEMKAATALYIAAADGYDDITARSRPLLAKEIEDAQKALDAAIARAERSRQQAVDAEGEANFPNDWNNAETRNETAKSARKNTPDEMKAAAALYIAAAVAYDDIARKGNAKLAQDRNNASRALQAAIARADRSRKQASDAKAPDNFPNEWRNAEGRYDTAKNAGRTSIAEMNAAIPLYNSAADAYDDIMKKNADRIAAENQRAQQAMDTAKARAEKERQVAIDAKAQTAVPTDFTNADRLFQQAMTDYNRKAATASDRFDQAASLFTAVAQAAEQKRVQAENAIKAAREATAKSAVYAAEAIVADVTTENVGTILNNQYLTESTRLLKLAEDSYAQGKYDDAIKYAQEAINNAQLSDDYIALQTKINEANDAIAAAQARLDWAQEIGVSRRYVSIYTEADTAFEEALEARSAEDWDEARDSALRVISILATVPDGPIFAAQYLVKNWIPLRDCLWNIAAKPEIYEDPWQWQRIYTANRGKFPQPGNPNLVLPGTILDIPSIDGEFRDGMIEGE